MDNSNLPMKKEEGFWARIKNNLLGFFSSKKQISKPVQNVQQTQTAQNNNYNNSVYNNFRAELSTTFNKRQHLYELRKKYEEDEAFVKNMSDQEIADLINLYNEETTEIYKRIGSANNNAM